MTPILHPPVRNACLLALTLLLMLLLMLAGGARAETVPDIDVARIPVTDRSAAALGTAQAAGLREVLVKLTGSASVPAEPALAEALQTPEQYLRSYGYEEGDDGLLLRLDYDGDALRALLQQNGLPLWTANRPLVMAWLVFSDGGRRRFASAEEMPELRALLAEAFRRRGLPLQLPLYDLEDAEQLSPGAAWRLSSAALMSASARYAPQAVLAGRVAKLSDGSWVGDWRLLDNGRWLSRPVSAADREQFIEAGADLVASTLAGRYAVVSGAQLDLRYQLRVRGVQDFGDFAALRRALEAVEAVVRVVPESVTRDLVTLRVEFSAPLEQLARLIELDGRFQRLPTAAADGIDYRWSPR
jgi:hypothetical protein